MDGRAYLRKLIADGLRAGQGRELNLVEVRGVAKGLVAAGALTQAEADQILADLEATMNKAGWVRVTHSVSMSGGGQAVAMRVSPDRPAYVEPPDPVLRAVVPLAGRTITVGDTAAHLVSLDVWSTMVLLRLAYRISSPGFLHWHHGFAAGTQWSGWDDAGTRYRNQGPGPPGPSAGRWYVEVRKFEPGPPEQVRELTLRVETPDGEATIPIRLRGDS